MGSSARTRVAVALLAVAGMVACSDDSPTVPPPASAPPPPASVAPSAQADFVDSFDDNRNDWPLLSDPNGTTFAVQDGQYRLTMPAGSIRYIRPAALSQRTDLQKNVTVEARASATEGTTYAFGVACRMSPGDRQFYVGRIFGDGGTEIAKRKKGEAADKVLKANRDRPEKLTLGKPVTLTLRCSEKDGRMTLELSVDGRPSVSVDDREPLPENPPGIYVIAGVNTPTSAFAYDEVRAVPNRS